MSEIEENEIIPEGCYIVATVEISQYINAEGELEHVTITRGKAPLSTLVGLCEIGKDAILKTQEDV